MDMSTKNTFTITLRNDGTVASVKLRAETQDDYASIIINPAWYTDECSSSVPIAVESQDKEIAAILDVIAMSPDAKHYQLDGIYVNQGFTSRCKTKHCTFDVHTLTTLTRRYMINLSAEFAGVPVYLECSAKWSAERLDADQLFADGYPITATSEEDPLTVGDTIIINPDARTSSGRFIPGWMKETEFEITKIVGNVVYINTDNKYTFKKSSVTKVQKRQTPTTFKAGDQLVQSSDTDIVNILIYPRSTSRGPISNTTPALYIHSAKKCHGRYRITNSPEKVGKKPPLAYSIGWIDADDIVKLGLYIKK